MESYIKAFKQYADYEGRTRRQDFWMYTLSNLTITIALCTVGNLIGDIGGFVALVYIIATLIPTTAITARRLHDTNRTGWLQLINMVPFGGIILLIFLCEDSSTGPNTYGPSPKESAA